MSDGTGASRNGALGGIRLYLVGLALLVALPLVVLTVMRIGAERTESRQAAEREAHRLARLVAARVDERIRTADALLLGLAANLQMTDGRTARGDSVLQQMLHTAAGRYANLFMTDAVGTLVASGHRGNPALDTVGALGDRNYFLRAQRTRDYVVGEPIRSRIRADSAWVVVMARGLYDARSRFTGMVGVSIRLDSLSDVVSATNLPGMPLVTIIDSSGMVLTRSVDGDRYRGQRPLRTPGQLDIPASVMNGDSAARFNDLDGAARVNGITRAAAVPWIVNVGLLESDANAAMRQRLLHDLGLFGGIGLIAVFLAYQFGRRVTQPLTRLADDARAVARGATGHRAVADGPTEIRLLADAFNQMADTVERRNAALADSERRYRLLFDSNPLPMWAWDADTRQLLAVNEAAIEKYGYDRDRFLQLEITDLLDPSELPRFAESRLPFLESRQGAGIWKHRTANGTLIEMEVVTTSSRRLGRASWLSVGIDVTARRATERALATSEEQLRQSQKMEAIGAFAGGIAHDFNNLLTGMLGYCDLAMLGIDREHEAYADIEEIRTLALRGADLTRQILAVSRKQVVQPAYIDPNDVVRGLNRLLQRVIGEHITFEAVLGEDLGSVHADAGQLEQVLLNLAANARDAMPNGGTLQIGTRALLDFEASAFGLPDERAWLAISVRDTGTGMSADVQRRIFEPFFTTKERGKGTGLGLALAYAMVEQAGGAIRVDSAPGEGATFHLLFPRHDRPAPSTASESADVSLLRGTETILVAEDEDSVRAVATAALASRGYNVLAAPDGEAALVLARQYPQRIDLLLTDVVMPGMNGRELAEALAHERPDMRVLFASGYTDDASLLQGIRTDELSFLQKPFSPADLVRRVRRMLDAPVRVG